MSSLEEDSWKYFYSSKKCFWLQDANNWWYFDIHTKYHSHDYGTSKSYIYYSREDV